MLIFLHYNIAKKQFFKKFSYRFFHDECEKTIEHTTFFYTKFLTFTYVMSAAEGIKLITLRSRAQHCAAKLSASVMSKLMRSNRDTIEVVTNNHFTIVFSKVNVYLSMLH